MPAAFGRQKQGRPEFLGHTENLSQEELHLRLLALIARVIPSSLERERGEGRSGTLRVACWGTGGDGRVAVALTAAAWLCLKEKTQRCHATQQFSSRAYAGRN